MNAVPRMTEPGGVAWKQTTFFPFAVTSRLAGVTALTTRIESDTYESSVHGTVNQIDSAVTSDVSGTSVFLVNRGVSEASTVTIDISALGAVAVVEAVALYDDDIHAANTLAAPERVQLRDIEWTIADSTLTIELPPVSWVALRVE